MRHSRRGGALPAGRLLLHLSVRPAQRSHVGAGVTVDLADAGAGRDAPRGDRSHHRIVAVSIVVGTCGFSYRDWVGPFYPLGTKSADMLEYYARSFAAVEIDSTYYAIPKPELFARMAARTPERFIFTVKAPGSVTHVPADADPQPSEIAAFAAC
ncbi:MAG: DUF72 domain-containing protein, partial [Candidatus Eremiobacteraeota bacterium]|nr:DUF72 domain-containing protein [Candidatus Eremiobacteraeota bacterium]